MKCLDHEEKSKRSQVVKVNIKVICFSFFFGWKFVEFDLYKSLLVTCSKDSDTCAFSRAEAWQGSTVKKLCQ